MDVAGDDEFGVGQFRKVGPVDGVDLRQSPAAAVELAAVGVAEAVAQGGEHSHAAVGAGAAAQGQDDPGRLQAEREQDGFAEAAAGRVQRLQLSVRQEPEAAGVGDLDDGGVAVERDDCLDVLAGGPGDRVAAPGEAGGDGGIDAAVTAVRQRKQFALDRPGPAGGIGCGAEPRGQCGRHLAGGEAAFELVGCDEGPHGFRGGGVVHVRRFPSRRECGPGSARHRRRSRRAWG